MNAIRIAVAGCCGRMGTSLLRLATADPGFEIVAAVTTPEDNRVGKPAGLVAGIEALELPITTDMRERCDVLLEFTEPRGTQAWAEWCAANQVALVSGTTGLGEAEQSALREAGERTAVLWAPNTSVGVNVLLHLVREVSSLLGEGWDIELVESHHRHKADAPSGTAQALIDAVCTARKQRADQVTRHGRGGRTGPRPTGEIGVHALRMGGVVGDHELCFASEQEVLTLKHRALSREAFAAGALRAARWIVGQPPGLYGMHHVFAG